MESIFASVDEAINEIRAGHFVIVTDNEERENEGDFIKAAQFVTSDDVNFVTTYGRGLLCQAITTERARELALPLMVECNTSLHETAFTVSVDICAGNATGISAQDRAAAIQAIVHTGTKPADLRRPGHVFPLIAKSGGVLERDGHTEATVELARLAGLKPTGILCEILDRDGSMARVPRLAQIAQEHGIKMVTVESIIKYVKNNKGAVTATGASPLACPRNAPRLIAEARLPTKHGEFKILAFENDGNPAMPHLALVSKKCFSPEDALVRVHSECFTGDVLMSLRCDCGSQLALAMEQVAKEGGIVLYMRQEGRGIGLTEKLRAYSLQDSGFDTVEANEKLGRAPDERDYAQAAAILRELGVRGLRLITNNPAKSGALSEAGFKINALVPCEIEPCAENRAYLAIKKSKMGHTLTLV